MRTPSEIVLDHVGSAPVDLDALAENLGIRVRRDQSMDNGISGKIERLNGSSGFAITLNANHPLRRQRFTLAHEIGHYVLHRDLIGDSLTDDGMYRGKLQDGSMLGSLRETEANRYAADLLMPARLIRTEWQAGNKSIAGLSQTFDVSEEAVRIRLKELRYMP